MKSSLIILITVFSIHPSFGKGKEVSVVPKSITQVQDQQISVFDAIENIKIVIDEINAGSREISEDDCASITYTENQTGLSVDVDGASFYILKSYDSVDDTSFNASNCIKQVTSEGTEINCISRSVEATENLDSGKKLHFYIMYDSKKLLKCPSDGSIQN